MFAQCARFLMLQWRTPAQYVSYDEANPFPRECPKLDTEGLDAWEDAALYDDEDVAETAKQEHSSSRKSPVVAAS